MLEILCDLADDHQVEMFLEVESSEIHDDDVMADWHWEIRISW